MKKTISIILCIFLVISIFPVSVFSKEINTLPIATISDVHYYPQCLAGNKGDAYYTYLEGSSCIPEDLDAILEASFESLRYQVEHEGLKYLVVVGDLTTNGEYEGHVEFAKMLRQFKNETGCEIYVTNGNHDINNYDASTFVNDVKEQAKITTPSDFVEIYHEFGFDQAYHTYKKNFGDGTQGSLSYSIRIPEGYRFIIADGGKYTADATEAGEDSKETAGAFTDAQLDWILSEAADAKKCGETPLLFTHWNMSGMNYFHEYLLQGFVIDDAYILQEKLADAGINYTFSGHQHVSDVDITYSDSGEPMYSAINPTLTQFPFSYRLTNFTKTSKGLKVDFNLCSVDEHSKVKCGDSYYKKPYRTTGFVKQYMGDDGAAEFIWKICKKVMDNYIDKINKYGSIIDFIENEFDIDLEKTFNSLIKGGITVNSQFTFTGANIMNLLEDIDSQLMKNYIQNKSYTYKIVKEALIEVCNYELSEVPCTKFINKYGFGDTSHGGTLGDLLCSVLAYMYLGNENISDDEFVSDVLKQTESTEFVDKIFSLAIEKIIKPIAIDEILAKTYINLDTIFPEESGEASYYTGFGLQLVIALFDNIMTVKTSDFDIEKILTKLSTNLIDVSFTELAESVLATDLIKYGSTIDELLYNLVDLFFDDNNMQATAYQLNVLAEGMLIDPDKDNNVTYYYNGPVKVTPTVEDMQIPSYITISYGKDASSSFTVTWFTKYSVTGTDIVFTKSNNGTVKAKYKTTEFSGKGFDFGSFGILPWTEKTVKHTVTVSGLEAGKTYKFKVGDKQNNFMSELCSVTMASNDGEFSFIAIADSAAVTPEQGEKVNNVLTAALENSPEASFIIHSGDIVRESDNSDRWDYFLNANLSVLKNTPIMVAPGTDDGTDFSKFLSYNTESQNSSAGLFYSFDYDNTHFITVNPNNATTDGGISQEQLQWLRNDLSSNDSLWTVLIINDSLYFSTKDEEETNDDILTQLLGYIKEYNIDLVLQGGNQYYARTLLMNGNTAITNPTRKTISVADKTYNAYSKYEGYVAVCPGRTGSYILNEDENDASQNTYENAGYIYNGKYYTYCSVTVKNNTLCVDTYKVNDNGSTKIIDSFAINKTASVITPGDVDKDSKITVFDARLALRVALGRETSLTNAQIYACHVTENTTVKVSDARAILRAAINLDTISNEKIYVSNKAIKSFAESVLK